VTGARPTTYLTQGVPGIGGVIKQRPEDFLVEEIPAYEPIGSGEHIYLFIEKRNLATLHAVRILADHFGVKPDAIGFAGLKDKLAVTRQLFSVHTPGKKPTDFPALDHPQLTVHWVDLHANKLRRGHLVGNRFVIRVRDVEPIKAVHALKAMRRLEKLGLPNRVGAQRFGTLGRNHLLGLALIRADRPAALKELLGLPRDDAGGLLHCPPSQLRFRECFEMGDYAQALAACPRALVAEKRVLSSLVRGGSPSAAIRSLGRAEESFAVAAWQSAVFNQVLDDRLSSGTLAALEPGDLAFKHDNGAVFAVGESGSTEVDEQREITERLGALAISPTGPMWGPSMTRASGAVDERELSAMIASGLGLEDLARLRRIDGAEGQRRPLRVPVTHSDLEAGVDEHGPYIRCTFELPRGAFATSLMDELMKPSPATQPAPVDRGPRTDERRDADESLETSDTHTDHID
jgi:tRNA pseudouridine13 synthase